MDCIPLDRDTMMKWVMSTYQVAGKDPRKYKYCTQIMISHVRWPINVSRDQLEYDLEELLYREEFGEIIKLEVRSIEDAGGNDDEETIGFLQYRRNSNHYPALFYFSHLNIKLYGKTLWFRPCGFSNFDYNRKPLCYRVKCNINVNVYQLCLHTNNDNEQVQKTNAIVHQFQVMDVAGSGVDRVESTGEVASNIQPAINVMSEGTLFKKPIKHICVYQNLPNKAFGCSSIPYVTRRIGSLYNGGLNRAQMCSKCGVKAIRNYDYRPLSL